MVLPYFLWLNGPPSKSRQKGGPSDTQTIAIAEPLLHVPSRVDGNPDRIELTKLF